jgi:hypothetical protein
MRGKGEGMGIEDRRHAALLRHPPDRIAVAPAPSSVKSLTRWGVPDRPASKKAVSYPGRRSRDGAGPENITDAQSSRVGRKL